MSEFVNRPVTKVEVDKRLWSEAINLDRAVYSAPLRNLKSNCEESVELFSRSLIFPHPSLFPFKLLPRTLANFRRNKTAFVPLPDGSLRTFAVLNELAERSDLPFDQALDYLHALGTVSYLGEMLSPLSILRLVQNGVKPETIPGRYRTLTSGFEYGVFNSSHPSLIGIEMNSLGAKADLAAKQIRETNGVIPGINPYELRSKLTDTRFCTRDQVKRFTDKELLALLGASETQRITAYIHPWYERIGRTTEEGRGLFTLRCGVEPLFLSSPKNRSTIEGYERGVAIGVTAVGFLREVSRRFGLDEEQIERVYKTYDLYSQLPGHGFKKLMYESPLRFIYGRNIFPDENVMRKYYEETHQIIMGLIDTFDISMLIQDPYSIYLAGQLVGRSKFSTNRVNI